MINSRLEQIDISKEAPVTEPERQYYYMAKARHYLAERSKAAGRPLRAGVITFGCQMNAKDSEKLIGILEAIGYENAGEDESADFVIYNTCTVRDNANQRVYGRLGVVNSNKRKNPSMKVALCGCMMQEPTVIEKIKTSYRFVDLIFGTHNIYKFAEYVASMFENEGRMLIDIWKDTNKIVEELPLERKFKLFGLTIFKVLVKNDNVKAKIFNLFEVDLK